MATRVIRARFATTLALNWWAFVLRGLVALVIALIAFLMPKGTAMALTLLFGAFAFVDGVLGLIAAVRRMQAGERWGWLALSGAVGVLVGLIVAIAPFTASLALAVFLWASIGIWALLSGALELAAAVRLRREIEGEFWLGLAGALSLAMGVAVLWMLFTRPEGSLVALGWLLGLYAALFGAIMLALGLLLRRIAREAEAHDGAAR